MGLGAHMPVMDTQRTMENHATESLGLFTMDGYMMGSINGYASREEKPEKKETDF
jgi:hypothetical protein